jgi:asparagine N-glycosylation enzyme membrane subunit Stt3
MTDSGQTDMYPDVMRGSGWLFFAGTILGLAGLMRIMDAFWAFRYKGALPDGLQNGLFGDNIKHYAWAWLLVGVILIVSSFLILARSQVARWIGYIAAVIMGLSAMTWMPYYPIWSIAYVTIAVLVFYALARYGTRDAT